MMNWDFVALRAGFGFEAASQPTENGKRHQPRYFISIEY